MDERTVQERAAPEKAGRVVQEYRMVASCEVEVPPPAALIIFGASGDLTRRKLFPSLYRLYKNRMLADNFFILGTSRIEIHDRAVPGS